MPSSGDQGEGFAGRAGESHERSPMERTRGALQGCTDLQFLGTTAPMVQFCTYSHPQKGRKVHHYVISEDSLFYLLGRYYLDLYGILSQVLFGGLMILEP